MIKGTQTNTDLESDTKTYELLNRKDDKVCVLVHNHPTDSAFSIEDYSETYITLKKWRKYSVIRTYKNKSKWLTTKLTTFCPRNADCPILNRVVHFLYPFPSCEINSRVLFKKGVQALCINILQE